MKKCFFIIISGILFNVLLSAQQSNEHFYYYKGEKVFLQQRTDKIYLEFAPNADKEQIRALTGRNTPLQRTSDSRFSTSAILEAKGGNSISPADIDFYKAKDEVVSAIPLFQYNKSLQALTDEFIVKLKPTTSYARLQELAKKNNCKVGDENLFVKNQFKINVLKTSGLNAMQMSNLFYETGLFEFSQPNFVYMNIFFSSSDPYFEDQWGLENIGPTGQYGESDTVDIKIRKAWQISYLERFDIKNYTW